MYAHIRMDMYTYTYVYMYVHTCIYTHIYIYIYSFIYLTLHTRTRMKRAVIADLLGDVQCEAIVSVIVGLSFKQIALV